MIIKKLNIYSRHTMDPTFHQELNMSLDHLDNLNDLNSIKSSLDIFIKECALKNNIQDLQKRYDSLDYLDKVIFLETFIEISIKHSKDNDFLIQGEKLLQHCKICTKYLEYERDNPELFNESHV